MSGRIGRDGAGNESTGSDFTGCGQADYLHGGRDGLAQFIVLELGDTFDSESPDDSQIGIATQVLERAQEDLLGVI